MKFNINLPKAVNIALLITFLLGIMYFARTIFIPLTFGVILAMLLFPVARFFEKWHIPRLLSILFTMILVISFLVGVIMFFSTQLIGLFDNIKNFGQLLERLLNKVYSFINEKVVPEGYDLHLEDLGNSGTILKSSTEFLRQTIITSTTMITYSIFVIIYVFLFLLYRSSFRKFIMIHFTDENAYAAQGLISKIQKVAQNYFFGLFIVVLIVGTLNGLGLWFIGIDYPFLFGYLAAVLTIIPYIGTTLGGTLPFLYALFIYDDIWMALAVVALYAGVQTLEGNFLTPKIVGSSVSLNPLFALIALIIGGFMWGIAGMILFIPLMAILKVIFDNIESLKPYGILLSSNFSDPGNDLFSRKT